MPVTATRERQSPPAEMPGETSWAERSAFGTTRGVPLWGAILLAVLPTAAGALIDQLAFGRSGLISTICFVVGCLLSVALVHRRSVFGPTVQTPLVVSIVLPLVAVLTDTSKGGGSAKIFTIAKPLINNFPMTAVTAILALGIGLLRMFRLQPARDNPAYQRAKRAEPAEGRPRTGPRSGPKSGPRSGSPKSGSKPGPGSGPKSRQNAAREQAAPADGRQPKPGQGPDERGRRPDRGQQRPDGQRDPKRRPNRGEPPQREGQQRGGPPGRGGPPPDRGGQGQGRPPEGGRGPSQGKQGKPPRGDRPQRPQRPERGAPPPGREGGGRGGPPPGRGRPAGPRDGGNQPPPQRPRKPKRNDFWD